MIAIKCPKCGGRGEITCYRGIAGGICFSCNGKGKIVQKNPPKPGIRFVVGAVSRETGEMVDRIFYLKARNEAAALKKAIDQLSGCKGYLPMTATVRPD